MATTEWGDKRLQAKYAEIEASEDNTIRKGVISSLAKLAGDRAEAYTKLSGETADLKGRMIETIGRFQGAQRAGEGAQRMRSLVEMSKLMVNAPVDFAKAAYAPDESILRDVRMGVAQIGGDTNPRDPNVAARAWQLFYAGSTPGAGNLWGTYKEMEETYGKDTYQLSREGGLEEKRQRVLAQIDTEKGAAEGFQERYRALMDLDGAWQNFLARNPQLDPNAEATYDAFSADHGIKDRLPKVQDTAFIQQLQKTVADTDTGRNDLYREDALAGIKGLDAEAEFLRSMLPKDGDDAPGPTEDTERDLMAAWLKRPDVQAWAKANGLQVGRVAEVTEQQKADIAAGKIPASTVTKYGMYTEGPDDDKAVNFAYAQMERSPTRNLFRRAGLTRAGGPQTVVEVEVGVDPTPYKDPENGKFYKDAKTGKYVPFDQVTVDDQGNLLGVVEVAEPPPVKTFRGVKRPMYVNDAVGSVRFVDEATGEEAYIAPEHIRRVNEPNVRSDASRPSIGSAIGKAVAKGAVKKAGLGEDENEMDIGDKPKAADVRERHQRVEAGRRGEEGNNRAANAGERRADRIGANAERLEALAEAEPVAEEGRRHFVPNDARRRLFARAGKAREREAQVRGEATAARDPGTARIPVLSDAALDERLNPKKSSASAVKEFTERAQASETDSAIGTGPTDRRQQPGLQPPAMVTKPKSDAPDYVLNPGRDFRSDEVRSKVSNDTTRPSTTTPTASTTDPRRAAFKKPKKPEELPVVEDTYSTPAP